MAFEVTAEAKRGYRPCVGIFLLNGGGEVLVARRADVAGHAWQMPQGGIDRGESPHEAAMREMAEEVGTKNASCLLESRVWRSYELPSEIAQRLWQGRFRGQTQKWLAFRFLGEDDEIALDRHHAEFVDWKWTDPERLVELIVPFKRDVYVSVVDEFRPLWA